MAQIIKGTEKPAPISKKSPIIKAEAYQELQEIKKLEAQTEQQRRQIISEAKQQAYLAKEQAMVEGANQAFAQAAKQALSIFTERIQYCNSLKEQLKILCDEITQKILGGKLTLSETEQNTFFDSAIQKIRARRKLKIQAAQMGELEKLKSFPEFEIETTADLPAGFLRIVTEVGIALWEEKDAVPKILAALSVNSQ